MSSTATAERAYESLFICPSDTPQRALDALIEKIKNAIAPNKGILRGVQVWGRRRLTYPIKHHRDALYVFIDFTGEAKAPESLKNLFRVTDFVLRHTIMDKVELLPPRRPFSPTGSPESADATAATPASAPAAAPAAAPVAPAAEPPVKATPSAEKEA